MIPMDGIQVSSATRDLAIISGFSMFCRRLWASFDIFGKLFSYKPARALNA